MKKMLLLVMGLYLCTMLASAAPKDNKMDGWISDSKCGAKGASASHAACAAKCIAAGEKPVLVTDKDQKVIPIDNPDSVKDHYGHHVQVSGTMTSAGAVHVDKISMLSQKGGTSGAMGDMH